MSNKAALISCFCDNEKKLNILNENIKKLKEHGLDVFLISPIVLPEETVKICDYVFYIKDNLILNWPLKVQMFGFWNIFKEGYLMHFFCPSSDYSWCGLNHIKKLTQIALTYDYDYLYNLIYDLDIDENVIKILNNPKDSFVCGFRRENRHIRLVSLHFMVFNREKSKKLVELLKLEKYLDFLNFSSLKEGKDAEAFFEAIAVELECEVADFTVTDRIKLERKDVTHSHSTIDGVKFFIEKNAQDICSEIKICVSENRNATEIEVVVNGKSTFINEIYKIFSLGESFLDIESAFVKTAGETMDLMPTLKSIRHSYIELKKL
jgi:hypothetical protein